MDKTVGLKSELYKVLYFVSVFCTVTSAVVNISLVTAWFLGMRRMIASTNANLVAALVISFGILLLIVAIVMTVLFRKKYKIQLEIEKETTIEEA